MNEFDTLADLTATQQASMTVLKFLFFGKSLAMINQSISTPAVRHGQASEDGTVEAIQTEIETSRGNGTIPTQVPTYSRSLLGDSGTGATERLGFVLCDCICALMFDSTRPHWYYTGFLL